MAFLVIIFAAVSLVCAVVLMKNYEAMQTKTARFVIGLMFSSLVLMIAFMFTSDFRQRVMTNIFAAKNASVSQSGKKYELPLPDGSSPDGGGVYITKSNAKQIESFYSGIADEDSFSSIKTNGVERISLKYKGKEFLVKHYKYKSKYRKIEVEAAGE